MNCLEAQSKIIAYIEYKLEKDEKQDFLAHIQRCNDCKEELNIYYTMIEGMRQLDDNVPLSKDFTVELQNRMDREQKSSKKRKNIFHSSVLFLFLFLISGCILGYINFLRILWDQEQNALKQAQGDYYYSDLFEEKMFVPPDKSLVMDINATPTEEPEETFYEKIRNYNYMQE